MGHSLENHLAAVLGTHDIRHVRGAVIRIHRCEHHYIVWLDEDRPVIIAILHERMDFMRRL